MEGLDANMCGFRTELYEPRRHGLTRGIADSRSRTGVIVRPWRETVQETVLAARIERHLLIRQKTRVAAVFSVSPRVV